MPVDRIDFAATGEFDRFEQHLVTTVLDRYFDGLGVRPLLGIGRHEATGGIMVIPWFDRDATARDVIDIIEETLSFLARAVDEQR